MRLSTTGDIRDALRYFEAMGLSRLPISLPASPGAVAGAVDEVGDPGAKALALKELVREMGDCQGCKLAGGRRKLVFGEGNPGAELMFIGEAPGRDEDVQGRPFVGRAGQLLTRLINKMGFKREEVYIGNIIKCRPPGNRDPEPDEIEACMPFIRQQVEIISPAAIMSLGRISSHTLLGTRTPISRLRGAFRDFEGIPVMPTFHPAYLLHNPGDKILVWNDAQQVLRLLGRSTG